jgi:hypothetical protein
VYTEFIDQQHRRKGCMISTNKHGEQSGLFGQWLTDRMRGNPELQDHRVYYDHGDKAAQPNVAPIKGICGEKVTNSTQLTQVDVMVAKPNREIVALVEIEERPSSPKKLIGDVFANLMCSQYSITINGEQEFFSISPDTVLIIAGIMDTRGKLPEQLQKTILPRLSHFDIPGDGVCLNKVWLIFREKIDGAIKELKAYFENLLIF